MDLHNRSILLTGAGSGIGAALALELAARSARITLEGRRRGPLEEVAAAVRERGGQAHVVALDLTGPGAPWVAAAAAQDHFGGVDVLINNAGNVRAGRLEAVDESEVLAQIALNLTAVPELVAAISCGARRGLHLDPAGRRLSTGVEVDPVDADINFYFDPVCPFAWMTSKWVRQVQAQRDYTVDWRFISLRLINAEVDYDAHFPPEYEAGHTAWLRLLRVAARARAEHGRESMAALYAAMGARIFDVAPDRSSQRSESEVREGRGTREFVEPVLAEAGLPLSLAHALDDESWDAEIRQETDEALALTGKDVGTPIIHFEPPAGVAFFGPVISRLPDEDSAAEMWDHVVGLARFPGFAELKRSLREQPQLAAFGVDADTVGQQEDWHGGSRRQKK